MWSPIVRRSACFSLSTIICLSAATSLAIAQDSLAHYRAGEAFLKQHNLQSAVLEFAAAEKGDLDPAWTLVWSHINVGIVLDALGQHDRAVKEYRLALDTKDDTFGAIAIANAYIVKAPTLEEIAPLPPGAVPVVNPQVLERTEPAYPPEALLARLEGTVALQVLFAQNGTIREFNVLNSLGLGLDEAAIDAVRQWKFAPVKLPSIMRVEVPFRLSVQSSGWRATKVQFENARPILLRADANAPGKMSPELQEEAAIDAAVARRPTATLVFEIDPVGVPAKIEIKTSSLDIWGEDAVRTLSEWRFSATGMSVPCTVELAWVAPR